MPVWHERTKQWVEDGRLVLLGVTQEQHADRCRLFAQWKEFGWPILHDPINLLKSEAVPIVRAVDEHGIVRLQGPRPETFEEDFLDNSFTDDGPPSEDDHAPGMPDADALLRSAEGSGDADAWRSAGDALAIWGGIGRVDEAVEAYGKAIEIDPEDKYAWFRLGVALRMRHESPGRRDGDFQAAVDSWSRALSIDPNQYVWRRRIEQYGPRLAKPYPFYDWVVQARAEISARGETPIALSEEPSGSEIAAPVREVIVEGAPPVNPDPDGRINRDATRLIEAEVVVIPPRVRPGEAARVHVYFRPSSTRSAYWNNESTPLQLWTSAPEGWTVDTPLMEAEPGVGAESSETRHLDFEVRIPPSTSGTARLDAFALYNVCEQAGGTCLFLRKDLTIEIPIGSEGR
ncbi:Tetratricopeptide repeat protein [Tautonia plasticadhaerens]|uniref:Tetratricopeptide repeat protein n=1 Tax=Tautonia plasticadhaerens TaxID=2527974 RepID=A0A518GVH0_9BACT|nr:Tetratricopeptide repeat protein [Tautonia plasticadhaerens]